MGGGERGKCPAAAAGCGPPTPPLVAAMAGWLRRRQNWPVLAAAVSFPTIQPPTATSPHNTTVQCCRRRSHNGPKLHFARAGKHLPGLHLRLVQVLLQQQQLREELLPVLVPQLLQRPSLALQVLHSARRNSTIPGGVPYVAAQAGTTSPHVVPAWCGQNFAQKTSVFWAASVLGKSLARGTFGQMPSTCALGGLPTLPLPGVGPDS